MITVSIFVIVLLFSLFQTNCTLTLYNISNENVIISASVPPKEQEELRENGEDLLDREKVSSKFQKRKLKKSWVSFVLLPFIQIHSPL